ncbi:MAG: FGGY-family carbohydrate kinase [Candidatus Bathyarchaeia archaeon]
MSDEEYLLGVDIGTLGSKGLLINCEGVAVAEHYVEHKVNVIRPGWVEQDPITCYWGDFKRIVQALLKISRIDPRDIKCIGTSGLTPGLLAIDRDLKPVRPCIIYLDRRAQSECLWVKEHIGEEEIFRVSGNTIDAYFAGYKILWYLSNEPGNYDRTWKILNPNGCITSRLTGEAAIDHWTASQFSPLYDYRRGKWSAEMCHQLSIDQDKLPKLYNPEDIIGEVTPEAEKDTGLAKGTSVIATGYDGVQSLFSVGALDEGESAFMYGTTGCWMIVQDEPRFDPRFINASNPIIHKYVIFGGMATTGALVRWFRDQFGHIEVHIGKSMCVTPYEILDLEAEKVPPGSDGLVILPYFMGERTPIWDPAAKGMIFGLTLSHTRAHIYRALLESTGYGLKHHMELAKSVGIRFSKMVAVNGGAKSRLWRQIVSDITGFPQDYVSKIPGASFADAYMAGLGIGFFNTLRDIKRFIEVDDTVEPDPQLYRLYSKLYETYLKLYKNTREEAEKLHLLSLDEGN